MYRDNIIYYWKTFRSFSLENKSILLNISLFILITLVLHKIWWMLLWPSETFSFLHDWANVLSHWVFLGSSRILEHVFMMEHEAANNTLYFSNGYIAVWSSCSGLKQFYQLFFLLVLFPGPARHKLWYIPTGLLLIFMVNIFRIVVLAFVLLWMPSVWDFVHLWILRPFYYVVIFLLWMIWVEKFKIK